MSLVQMVSDFNGNVEINGVTYLSSSIQVSVNEENSDAINMKYFKDFIVFNVNYSDFEYGITSNGVTIFQSAGNTLQEVLDRIDILLDDSIFKGTVAALAGAFPDSSGSYSGKAIHAVGESYLGGQVQVDGGLSVLSGNSTLNNFSVNNYAVFNTGTQTAQGGEIRLAQAVANHVLQGGTDTAYYTKVRGAASLNNHVVVNLPSVPIPNSGGPYAIVQDPLTGDASWADTSTFGGGGGLWTQTGNDIYYNTGNVGIGTSAPSSSLHVKGENDLPDNYALRVGNSTSDNILAIRNDGKIGFFGENNTAHKIYIQGSSNEQVFLDSFMRLGWAGGATQFFKGWSGRITANLGGTESARFRSDGLRVRNSIHLDENSGDTGDTRFTRLNTGTVAIGNNADDGSGTLIVGNVGIGTAAPESSLHIAGSSGITMGRNSPQNQIATIFADSQDNLKINAGLGLGKDITIGNKLAVRASDTRLYNALNLGSSATPDSGYILHARGSGKFEGALGIGGDYDSGIDLHVKSTSAKFLVENTSGGGGEWVRFSAGTAGSSMKFSNTGGFGIGPVASKTDTSIVDSFWMTSSGNVGIGTATPESSLHVKGANDLPSNYALKVQNSSSVDILNVENDGDVSMRRSLFIGNDGGAADGYLTIKEDGGPSITIEGAGNLLFGTGSTGAGLKFIDQGDGKRKSISFFKNTGGIVSIRYANNAYGDGGFYVEQQNSAQSNGNALFLTSYQSHNLITSRGYGSTGLGRDISFAIRGSNVTSDPEVEVMRLTNKNATSPHSVGIGTTTPSEKLEVEGNARINGALQINDPSGTGFALPTTDGTSGQVLSTDGSGAVTWVNQSGGGGGASTLNDLTDVLIPSVADGNLLNYNSAFSSWIPVNSISLAGNITSAAIVQGNTGSFTTTTSESYKFVGTGDFSIEPATTLGGDLYIKSNKDIIVEIDTNNNDTPSKFSIVDGTERFSVDDAGVARFNNAFSLPNADGTGGQVLSTNGSGTVSWVDQSQVTASESYRVYATARTQAGGTADVAVGVSVSKSATGTYDYTFDQARPDTSYVVMTTPVGYPLSDSNIYVSNISTTGFTIYCTTGDNGGTDDPLIDNAHSISVIVTDQLDAIKGDQGLSGDAFDVAGEAAGRTLVAADHLKYLRSTSATAVTFTVPPQSSVAWVDNAEVVFEQAGAGQITIAAGAGVTINSSETLKSGQQYAVIGLKRVASDTWTLTGERELA